MLELNDLPLIDQHVHIFNPESDQPTFDPLATFSLGGDRVDFLESGGHTPTDQEKRQLVVNQRQTMIYHEAMHAVARYLGCEPTREAIIAARAKKVSDYKAYIGGMYRDINLESNIVDLGYPKNVSLEEFEALTGVPAYGLFRIEPLIGELWEQHDSLEGLEKAFEERIRKIASDPKIIALKSVIAYRTGLDLQPQASQTVSKSVYNLKRSPDSAGLFARIHAPRSTRDDVKRIRDYILWRALELSIELNLPFQIHTGMGDQDLDIKTSRPGLMAAVFRDEKLRHAKIILLHGAHPFYVEAAYLANVFPNVYLDLSEFNPMLGPGVGRVIASILELAPFTKVVYSSDCFGSPELQWIAAKKGRAALASCLGAAVDAGNMSQDAARTAARLILADNVRLIYGI
jgi:predicted TIM-barrel fold metal-dependent hydrolase